MWRSGVILGLLLVSLTGNTASFSDLAASDPGAIAIEALRERGVIHGYEDGTFRPNDSVSRAEFVALITRARLDASVTERCTDPMEKEFSDVEENAWYKKYLCSALQQQIVTGFPDGTFRSSASVTLSQAAKILLESYEPGASENRQSAETWYRIPLGFLGSRNAILENMAFPSQKLTRRDVADILYRLLFTITDRPAVSAETLIAAACIPQEEETIPGVDMAAVRGIWTQWINAVRADMGLHPYAQDQQLMRSAAIWSRQSRDQGYMTHKRAGQTAYYDYGLMTDWFADLGLQFANVQSVTFTENIGWGMYRCNEDDCTDELIDAMRSTFDFFMSERDKAYRPHFNSIMNPKFNSIGMSIAVGNGKYYLTSHYGTDITTNPEPVCP